MNDKILYEYNPESDNKKRNKDLPSSITFLQHNAHITPLNHNLKSYQQLDFTEPKTLHYLDLKTNWTEINTEEELSQAIAIPEPQYLYYFGDTDLFQYYDLFRKVLHAANPPERIKKPKEPKEEPTSSSSTIVPTSNTDTNNKFGFRNEDGTGNDNMQVEDTESCWTGTTASTATTALTSKANSDDEAEQEEDLADDVSNVNLNTSSNARKRRDSVVLRKEGDKTVRKEVNSSHIRELLQETRKAIIVLREQAAEVGLELEKEIQDEENRLVNETPHDQIVQINSDTPINTSVGLLQRSKDVCQNIFTTFDEEGALNLDTNSKATVLAEGETLEEYQYQNKNNTNVFNP